MRILLISESDNHFFRQLNYHQKWTSEKTISRYITLDMQIHLICYILRWSTTWNKAFGWHVSGSHNSLRQDTHDHVRVNLLNVWLSHKSCSRKWLWYWEIQNIKNKVFKRLLNIYQFTLLLKRYCTILPTYDSSKTSEKGELFNISRFTTICKALTFHLWRFSW